MSIPIFNSRLLRGVAVNAGAVETDVYDLTAVRFASGTDTTLISAGIPLAPGLLDPADLNTVRVLKNGVEQPIYVEELPRRHLDGTVRSILVQCDAGSMANGAEDTTWELRVNGATRTTTDRAKDTSALAFASVPAGFLFYTDPQDRVDSMLLLGPTTTIANSPAREPYLKYHSENALSGNNYAGVKGSLDSQWNSHTTNGTVEPEAGAFFNQDIGWANLTYWVRGGATVYLRRFLQYARPYVRDQQTGSGGEWQKWARTPRSHYWLTGDPRTITHIEACAASAVEVFENPLFQTRTTYDIDSRHAAQNGWCMLSAWLTGGAADNKTVARYVWDYLLRMGETSGPTDGVHYYSDRGSSTPCFGQKPFMQGVMHAFLIEFVENAEPSLRATYLDRLAVETERLWDMGSVGTANVSVEYPGFSYNWSPENHAQWVAGDAADCQNLDGQVYSNDAAVSRGSDGYLTEVFAYYGFHANNATATVRAEDIFARANIFMGAWEGFEGGQAMFNMWSLFGLATGVS